MINPMYLININGVFEEGISAVIEQLGIHAHDRTPNHKQTFQFGLGHTPSVDW